MKLPRRGRRRSDPEGRMTLAEHLGELRTRLFVSMAAVVVFAVLAYAFYDRILTFLERPAIKAIQSARAQGHDVQLSIIGGVATAFTLQIKISCIIGIILAAPVWLFELWRFVTPGLRRNERRHALAFVGSATPLFLAGVAFAYYVLPKGVGVLAGFTPKDTTNIIKLDQYISFVIQISLFFGLGFVLPVFVVALNAVGILPSRRLWGWWRQILFGVFLFAAIATPTGDPVNLSLLAFPILGLVFGAMGIASLNDRRRRRRETTEGYAQWDDDETSPLPEPEPLDRADYSDLT
ncbi:MAG TPA: twin-arginine translocase subunit TatC [Actinomycetes bacterium]|nr:twin-arginine translocase subunit TatC [Actinomycetes bacterium]